MLNQKERSMSYLKSKIFLLIFSLFVMFQFSGSSKAQQPFIESYQSASMDLDTNSGQKSGYNRFEIKESVAGISSYNFGGNFFGDVSLIFNQDNSKQVDLYTGSMGYEFAPTENVIASVEIGKIENFWFSLTKENYSFRNPLTTGYIPRNNYGMQVSIYGENFVATGQVFNGTGDSNKAVLTTVSGSPMKNLWAGGYFYTLSDYRIFGGKVSYLYEKKKIGSISLSVEAGLSQVNGENDHVLTSGIVAWRLPKSNFGVEFVYNNLNPVLSSLPETRNLMGALTYNSGGYEVALGFSNMKSNVTANKLFLSTGFNL